MENNDSFSERLFSTICWGTFFAAVTFGGAEVFGYSPVVSTVLSYAFAAGVAFSD